MAVATIKTNTWEHVVTLPEGLTLHAKGEEGKDTVEILVVHPETEAEEGATLGIVVTVADMYDWLRHVMSSLAEK